MKEREILNEREIFKEFKYTKETKLCRHRMATCIVTMENSRKQQEGKARRKSRERVLKEGNIDEINTVRVYTNSPRNTQNQRTIDDRNDSQARNSIRGHVSQAW